MDWVTYVLCGILGALVGIGAWLVKKDLKESFKEEDEDGLD